MPKPAILFLLLMISVAGQGQVAVHRHNKIDDIYSAKQIKHIVDGLLQDDNEDYVVNRKLSFKHKENKAFAATNLVLPWVKADLDNNGYTDLLVIEKRRHTKEDECMIVCILDSGDNHFFIKRITREKSPSSAFALFKTIDNKATILYYHFQLGLKYKPGYLCDTLVYKFDDFVEYKPRPETKHRVEEINFEMRPSYMFGRAPSRFINISANQTITTYTIANIDSVIQQKEYVKTIRVNAEQCSQIINLLNYIDFSNLNSRYRVGWTCDRTSCLTITYDNGQTKKIEDYGLLGTFGLNNLYNILIGLAPTQNWQ